MKKIIIFIMILNSLLLASNTNSEKVKKDRAEKQLKIELEKEKKYSIEQTFYNEDNYDFKGAEVNPDTVDSIQCIEVDDFNMDSVYD